MRAVERIFLSTDPKDPNFRLRVGRPFSCPELVEIAEEELTSAAPTAQVTEVAHKLILTREQAEWLVGALQEVLTAGDPEPHRCRTCSTEFEDEEDAALCCEPRP